MRHLLAILALFVPLMVSGQTDPALPTVTSFDCPKYPPKAKEARLSGMVKLQVTNGHGVADVKVKSGHPLIAAPSVENVLTWKFADHSPTTFEVIYFYVTEGEFKRDPITKCSAKTELPTKVTVSTSRWR